MNCLLPLLPLPLLLLYRSLSTSAFVCARKQPTDRRNAFVWVYISIAYEWLMEFKYLCNYPKKMFVLFLFTSTTKNSIWFVVTETEIVTQSVFFVSLFFPEIVLNFFPQFNILSLIRSLIRSHALSREGESVIHIFYLSFSSVVRVWLFFWFCLSYSLFSWQWLIWY